MARGDVNVIASGRKYRLGRTATEGVIWRKRPWGWRVVARYPLTDEGWRVASGEFAMWEPEAEQPSGESFRRSLTDETGPRDELPARTTSLSRSRQRSPKWAWVLGVIVLLGAAAGGLFAGGVLKSGRTSPRTPSATRTPSPTSPHTTSPPTNSLPAVGNGYLATGSTGIIYLQWADNAGALTGTLQEVRTTGQPPTETMSSTTGPISGTVTGSQISLSFNGGPDHFGTLTSGGFTINFRLANGLLTPVHFKEASTSQYNLAVARLRAEVTSANTAATVAQQKAAAEAAAAQRLAAEQAAIQTAATTVNTDIASLASAASTVVAQAKQMSGDMQNVTNALATTKAALQHDLALVSAGTKTTECYVASQTVAYEARQTVSYAARQTFGYAAQQTVIPAIKQLNTPITSLRAAFADYQRVQAVLPNYVLPNAPTKTTVTGAVSKAQSTVAAAIAIANGYIEQANADVATAFGYADQAYKAANCGAPPTPTAPVPTIT